MKFSLHDSVGPAITCKREKKLFPLVAKIYRLLLTSPTSVCKSERTLSRLKLLKNYLKSTIKQERLVFLTKGHC